MTYDSASLAAALEAAGPQGRASIIQAKANEAAQHHYDARRSSPQWRPQPPRRVEALRKAVLFIMIKDEADIIRQNLEHHYTLGFRRFFILDNASTDESAAIITAFRSGHADAGVFYAYDFVVGHFQAAKMKALDLFMQSYLHYEDLKPEWLFFVDADEFITCGSAGHDESLEAFNRVLNDPTKNLLVLHWVQCASSGVIRSLEGAPEIFAAFPHAWPTMQVAVPKVAYRLGLGLEPIQGNHNVAQFPYDHSTVAVLAEIDFYLFHFPNRTVQQLRKKLINANAALSVTPDRDGLGGTAGHWRTYFQWYTEHGDVALERILQDHVAACSGGT